MFPFLGSGNNAITVFAENRINVERTLRFVNILVSLYLNTTSAKIIFQYIVIKFYSTFILTHIFNSLDKVVSIL